MRGPRTAYTRVLSELEKEKYEAETSELAETADKAWSENIVAERHFILINKFMFMADAERQLAARLASTPGRQQLAEQARVRATRFYDIAERHRKLAEEHGAEGAKLSEEVQSMHKNGNSGGGGRGGGRPQQQQPARPQPAQPSQPAAQPRQRQQPQPQPQPQAPMARGSEGSAQ